MNKILGLEGAYTSAVEKRGRNMVISASLVEEMIDRIRELEAGGWISVDDRLPPEGEEVIGIDRDGTFWMADVDDGWWSNDTNSHFTLNITHWMPLSSPPLNEEQG